MGKPGLILSCLVLLVGIEGSAFGNAAAPQDYEATVDGNSVSICPRNFEDRTCPDSSGMLREDADTGELVLIADFCDNSDGSPCYLDECVPEGAYRYGFATPYECFAGSAYMNYYIDVVVESVMGNCQRSEGNAGPIDYSSDEPWKNVQSNEYCVYQGPAEGGSGSSGDSEIGCRTGASGPANIFAVNGFVFLLALLILYRRRA